MLAGRRAKAVSVERLYPSTGRLAGHDPDALMGTLRRVDEAASGWKAPAYWKSRSDFLTTVDVLLLAHIDGAVGGFCALQWMRSERAPVVYVDATAVHPAHQNSAIATLLILEAGLAAVVGHAGTSFFFALRTENPVVYSAFHGVFGAGTYPQLDGTPPPEDVVAAAEAVARHLDQADLLDIDRLVVQGAHRNRGKDIRPPLPPSRSSEIASYFADNIDGRAGDAMLMVIAGNVWTPIHLARGFLRRRRAAHTRRASAPQADAG
jgi:GNAT superfamily N-acetyltransferase